jgi:hypothetical protein
MNHTALRRILSIALLNVAVGICATAQTATNAEAKAAQRLTGAEAQLVAGSKRALLETGFSEPYFEEHFQVIRVINQPGDRRIVWKFSINEYEATLNDAVGYYSAEDGRRVNTHSIKQVLGSTRDIKKTITRKQAEKIMTRCIGKYTEPTIVFKALTAQGNATLFMVAAPAGKKRAGAGEQRVGPSYFGNVNLETGKCTLGKGATAREGH